MRIAADGTINMAATSGNKLLTVKGQTGNGYYGEVRMGNADHSAGIIGKHISSGNANLEFWTEYYSSGGYTKKMTIRYDGNIGINDDGSSLVKLAVKGQSTSSSDYVSAWYNSAGTTLFYVRNDGYGFINASAWAYGSDLRIKENISDIKNGLDMVLKMKPKHFDYINGTKDNLGFIAQDVQEIIPQAVSVSNEESGMLALKTDFLVPYLVKAIQELTARVQYLENK
jgi:hypothetical protein